MLIKDLPPRLQFRGTLHLESPPSSQAAGDAPRLQAGHPAPDAHQYGMSFLRHLCLLLLLGLSSCTYFANKIAAWKASKKSAAEKRVGEARVIGVIEMVNPEQNYVLINCEQRMDIPAGTEVLSQGINGTDAKLRVTPERKGNYITADITLGVPQLRDLVIYQVKSEEAPQPDPITAPTTAPTVATGAVAPLAPVMQADVLPSLNAPYQPLAPGQPSGAPATAGAPPPLQQGPLPPASKAGDEPPADLSKLPPVIR